MKLLVNEEYDDDFMRGSRELPVVDTEELLGLRCFGSDTGSEESLGDCSNILDLNCDISGMALWPSASSELSIPSLGALYLSSQSK